jgi:hypothetical protein
VDGPAVKLTSTRAVRRGTAVVALGLIRHVTRYSQATDRVFST